MIHSREKYDEYYRIGQEKEKNNDERVERFSKQSTKTNRTKEKKVERTDIRRWANNWTKDSGTQCCVDTGPKRAFTTKKSI